MNDQAKKSVTSIPQAFRDYVDHQVEEKFNRFMSDLANNVLYNAKLFLKDELDGFIENIKDVDDIRSNVAALASIARERGLFTKEEFQKCFREMERSFGVVNKDGTMDGKVVITDYNFGSTVERKAA